jgi:zinc protease
MMKNFLTLLYIVLISITAYAQKPDRSAPPALGPAKNVQLPPIQRFTLSNGLNVVLMEKHSVPMVQVNLLLQTGSFDDPEGKEGLSSFAMDLLDEGAGAYSALALADEIDFLGASISTYSSNFSSGVNCSAPVARLDKALELMSDIVLRPAFAEPEIERVRKLRINGLLQAHDEPNTIALRAFSKYLFDASTPYGKFANEASITSYTKDDLVNYHKTNFTTGNSTLIIVGDTKREQIITLLEKHFASYNKGTTPKKPMAVPAQLKNRTIYIVDKPGAAQSVIRIGRIGIARNDADYSAVEVMNTILGGSFTSRLNSNLREQHGYSYGAGSGFSAWPVAGPFTASSSVQTDVTGPALGEFFKEFNRMRQPMPQGDFDRGKNYVALGYAENFETNRSIAASLAEMILYQLPENYFNTYVEKTLAVTKKSVEAVAKKHIVSEKMLIVIVGDREKIEADVNKLKLGKTTVLSIEDVLGKKPSL